MYRDLTPPHPVKSLGINLTVGFVNPHGIGGQTLLISKYHPEHYPMSLPSMGKRSPRSWNGDLLTARF